MLNAEHYKKQIEEKHNRFGMSNKIVDCTYEECATCIFSNESNPNDGLKNNCTIRKVKWLLSEYHKPINLLPLEYNILKFIADNTNHKYIARDKSGKLYLYDFKPRRSIQDEDWWVGKGLVDITVFNKLFCFITWYDEEPTEIKEVLNNCRVVEGEIHVHHATLEDDEDEDYE